MKKYFPVVQYMNVPNMITTLGLFSGIVACYFVAQGMLRNAIICLFLATFLDLLDGFSAVKLNQQTKFGQYMDALVDFFICCIIPVLMLYAFAGISVLIVIAAAFYGVCGLWRLAYFISVTAGENHDYFSGLPVPGAMFSSVASIWLLAQHGFPAWFCAVIFFLTGLLMVSAARLKKYGVVQKIFWAMWLIFLVFILMG